MDLRAQRGDAQPIPGSLSGLIHPFPLFFRGVSETTLNIACEWCPLDFQRSRDGLAPNPASANHIKIAEAVPSIVGSFVE